MKLNKLLKSLIGLSAVLHSCASTLDDQYENLTPLQAYGKMVFHNEKCGNCHALHIDDASSSLRSLDGVGDIYEESFIYQLLQNPEQLNPETRKKAYPHLLVNEIDRNKLESLKSEYKNEQAWDSLTKEAQQVQGKIFVHTKMSEGIALIAYLKTISTSKEKRAKDSIQEVKRIVLLMSKLDSISIIEADGKTEYIQKGESLFRNNCTPCHGANAQGVIGPNHTDEYWKHGGDIMEIAQTITVGVPQKGMPAWGSKFSSEEIAGLVAYIRSLKGSNPPNARVPEGEKE